MTETELESMLAPYGTVISTRILRDANMQPRGVGFARYGWPLIVAKTANFEPSKKEQSEWLFGSHRKHIDRLI